MEDGFRLQDSRIAIIGLGLMGGSLALALKGKCAALYGIDTDPATLELALEQELVDSADRNAAKLLPQADFVVLATPVHTIISLIRDLPSLINNPCIVLDLGSTKSKVMAAMEALPSRFDVLGGHPICGKEKLGIEHADGLLYQGAAFVITPLERTTVRARRAAEQIVAAVGAHLLEMDAEDHDRALAFTSHLPFLLSSALALTVPAENAPLIGSGFRSTARLAATPLSMMMGVLESNRENLLYTLKDFQHQLHALESALLSEDWSQLEFILDSSQSSYQAIMYSS